MPSKRNFKPIFKQMQNDLKQAVASKKLLPGEVIPSESSLAKKYAVCRTTVRKALDELVKDNVIVKRPGKGAFVKDVNSLGPVKKAVKTIGFAINPADLTSGALYYAKLVEGMQKTCSQRGIRLALVRDEDLNSVDNSLLDAIVFMRNYEAVEKLKGRDIPILLINRFTDEEDIGYIAVDYRKESRRGIEYLISLGHKKIGVIGADNLNFVTGSRTLGCLDALKAHNIPMDDKLFLDTKNSAPDLYQRIKSFLAKTDATALFITTASYISPFGTAVYELNKRIPQEFSVICFDDVENSIKHPGPPLSSIIMPLMEMGEKAVEYLEKKVENKAYPPLRELVHADLIIRQSTSVPFIMEEV